MAVEPTPEGGAEPTRKGSVPIKVYCLPEEKEQIRANAEAAGLPVSSFLLKVGQGYRVAGVVDHEQVRELARINGDLGRLGGLLKLWLTHAAQAADFGPSAIRAVLRQIEENQRTIATVMQTVVRPRAEG
jgi:hypothetical protein